MHSKAVAIDTSSEAWRHECEARSILALYSRHARRRRLMLIEKARGSAIREQLEQTMQDMQTRQAARAKAAITQIKALLK